MLYKVSLHRMFAKASSLKINAENVWCIVCSKFNCGDYGVGHQGFVLFIRPSLQNIFHFSWEQKKLKTIFFFRCNVNSTNWCSIRRNTQQWNWRWKSQQRHRKCTWIGISVSRFYSFEFFALLSEFHSISVDGEKLLFFF